MQKYRGQKKKMRKQCWQSFTSLKDGSTFAEKPDLISISTVRTSPRDIASDRMKAHQIGDQCYSNFKEERLEKDSPAKKFHDPIQLTNGRHQTTCARRKK